MPTEKLSDWQIYERLANHGYLTGDPEVDETLMKVFRFAYEHDGSSYLSPLGEWLSGLPQSIVPQSA